MADALPLQTRPKGLQRIPARVESIERLHPDLALIRLRFEPKRPFTFHPGQFVYLYGPTGDAQDRRPYSIASPPSEPDAIDLAVKSVVPEGVSHWVVSREAGDVVHVTQPLGSFRFETPPGRTAVFLATGTGVAPLRAMLKSLWASGDDRETWLYVGSGLVTGLPYHAELVREAQVRNRFHYVPVLSRAGTFEWNGARGWIQEPFRLEFQGRRDFDAYICGVRRMVDDVKVLVASMGLDPRQIHTERYD